MHGRIAAVVACAGSLANAQVHPLQEVPGLRELSGRLIAKPMRASALRARGLGPEQVHEARRRARAALAPFEEVWHEELVDHYVVALPEGEAERDAIAGLMATGLFEFVEPDWILYPVECPDDPGFGDQWHHDAVHLGSCAGWDIETGGAFVSVGICDTGVQTGHPDLALHRLEGYNATSRLWESEGGRIGPVHPHGTQTTGCAAANGDNGAGVAGVGWNLGHRMLRVSDDSAGGTTLAILLHAALTAVESGDRVASVSYSGADSAAIRATATQIKAMGGLLVWAAGNDGARLDWGDRDADDLICVGATDMGDARPSFSAYGPSVDLLAPGVEVYTTTTGSAYTGATGTSFSAPLVAGLIALIWSHNPGLAPDEVEQALKLGCLDLGASGADEQFGYGRIDIRASLLLAGDPPVMFEYPAGRPDTIDPRGGTAAEVLLSTNDAELDGRPMLWFDDGSGFEAIELVHVRDDAYLIIFPAFECGSVVRYYLTAATTEGGTAYSPRGAPGDAWEALAVVGVAERSLHTFEVDGGWTAGVPGDTAETGVWTRMNPAGTAAQPEDDVTASGFACWVTDGRGGELGDHDVDGGKTTLMSPVLDLSAMRDPMISYWRWYSNEMGGDPQNDVFKVGITDGGAWVNVERLGPSGEDATVGWRLHEFHVAEFVAPNATVQVRFIAEDAGAGSIVEAALDDFRVSEYDCGCAADFNRDGLVSTLDVIAFLNAWSGGEASADMNGDGLTNSQDAIGFLNAWNAGC
ncbi:MAG TPA: S8 family serine peptidase [Phycisphaerales bacterium]|nr:S8 family serine peptidase [Phycisphaerales bacterium]